MTPELVTALIRRIAQHFPFWARMLDAQGIAVLTEDWLLILGDLDPKIVAAAVATLLAEPREFAPSVGHINAKARELAQLAAGVSTMDAGAAWQAVCASIEAFGYGVAWNAERRTALPSAAIRAAEDFGLMRIRMREAENASTDFAQFRDIYNTVAQREAAQRNMPTAVRQLMQDVAKRLSAERERKQLPGGES